MDTLKIAKTSKFSVWTHAGSVEVAPPVVPKDEVGEEDEGHDPNSAMSMLGGSFAMWMFSPPDSDDEGSGGGDGGGGEASGGSGAAALPDAATVLHAVASASGPAAGRLADAAYWEGLGDATAALYPGRPLLASGVVAGRRALDGGEGGVAALAAGLGDDGYFVVPPSR